MKKIFLIPILSVSLFIVACQSDSASAPSVSVSETTEAPEIEPATEETEESEKVIIPKESPAPNVTAAHSSTEAPASDDIITYTPDWSEGDRDDYLDTFEYVEIDRSTALDRIGYSEEYGDLYIRFLDSQKEYAYEGVDREVFNELLDADSIGRFYNSEIKGQYNCIRLFD